MTAAGKYAHLELERRFLLAEVPADTDEASGRRIHDRYIIATRLRLRRVDPLAGGATEYKLGQKDTPDPTFLPRMRHTSLYLTADEYGYSVGSRPTFSTSVAIPLSAVGTGTESTSSMARLPALWSPR